MGSPGYPIRLDDVWGFADADEFAGALRNYIRDKELSRELPLSICEQNVRDIFDLYAEICIDGFATLFYQVFSLADCQRVEAAMREMELIQLTDSFAEARFIYCRGRNDLSEAEYAALDPFSLDGAEGERFDEIGRLFIGSDSELFKIAAPIQAYAIKHRAEFT